MTLWKICWLSFQTLLLSTSRRGTRQQTWEDNGAFYADEWQLAMRQQAGLSCIIRANKGVIKEGKKKAFFIRENSSCWAHIHQHYEIYKEWCKAGNISESHHMLSQDLYWQMKADKKVTGGTQLTLDGALRKPTEAKIYTCDVATLAVAQFVACDDQVHLMVVVHIKIDVGQIRLLLLLRNQYFTIVLLQ